MRRYGITKRRPDYIPPGELRDAIMRQSKADLAELVYDYLIRIVGETESRKDPHSLLGEMRQTLNAIKHAVPID